jgi:hypothetical protein
MGRHDHVVRSRPDAADEVAHRVGANPVDVRFEFLANERAHAVFVARDAARFGECDE